LKEQLFIINCKNYEEIGGSKIIKFIKTIENITKKYPIKIVVAPPHHLLAKAANSSIPIFAQHLDNVRLGSTTGFMVPDLVKKSMIAGSLINHSEHRISSKDITELVSRLKKLGMASVVCVKDVKEAKTYAKLNPDYIAIEPPELIGSGRAVSKERPELITKAVTAVKSAKNNTKLLCGAGLVSGADVKKAIELGSNGILVASGIVKAKNWHKIIEEFAKEML
jgi:triosephosphate isomerase